MSDTDNEAQSFTIEIGSGAERKSVPVSAGTVLREHEQAPEMVLVPPGKFWMGLRDGEDDPGVFWIEPDPRHEVEIREPLLVGRYPVTFDEWEAFINARPVGGDDSLWIGVTENPSDEGWGRGRRPVINISWHDAEAYTVWLSRVTGHPYRLLTEAEWEYCCRAGTETAFSTGKNISADQANHDARFFISEEEHPELRESGAGAERTEEYDPYDPSPFGWHDEHRHFDESGVYPEQTTEVGNYPANPFGLHDMHGNVWEWCEDSHRGNLRGIPNEIATPKALKDKIKRMRRGGSWLDQPWQLHSAMRSPDYSDIRSEDTGFRVARTAGR